MKDYNRNLLLTQIVSLLDPLPAFTELLVNGTANAAFKV